MCCLKKIYVYIEHISLCIQRKTKKRLGINIHVLLYVRQMTNQDLLNSTGNATQYYVITYMRKEPEKK